MPSAVAPWPYPVERRSKGGFDRKSKVVVVIPAHNEERCIGSVVLMTLKYADIVVVVDDGSVDATADVAKSAGALVVRHEHNQGKGVALATGFRLARRFGASVVVTLDADGQHLPEELPSVVDPILSGRADIVVGSRYLDTRSDVPRVRVVGHQVFNFLSNRSSGISVTDSQSGFRAFSARAVQLLTFNSTGFSVETEMQFLARDHGLRMFEVPIEIRYQDRPKRNVFVHGLMVLNGMLRLIGQHRPLLFLCIPGLLAIIVSIMLGWSVVEIYRSGGVLALGYALVTVLFAIVGLVTFFTGVILHSMRGLLLTLVKPPEVGVGSVQLTPGRHLRRKSDHGR